jgi:hypothetical protein
MLNIVYLGGALYFAYKKDLLNANLFILLLIANLLFEIKNLLTKKENDNGNN